MVAPSGNQQQGLADRIPTIAVALKQELPDRLAARRSARLARRPRWDPRSFKRCHEKPHLGRLACALAALDRDKPPARHRIQRRWPQTR